MIGRTNAMGMGLIESASYPTGLGTLVLSNNMQKDGDYIYSQGGAFLAYKLLKTNTTDMTQTNASITASINKMLLQGDYIYAASGNYANKYAKSDLSLVQASTSYGATVNGIATDGTYLYIIGDTTKTIRKYALTDLTSLVAESSAFAANIKGMIYDNSLLYVVSGANIYSYDTATLTLQTTSTALGHTPSSTIKLAIDSGYVFYQDTSSGAILYKLDLATLGTLTSINMAGDGALATIVGFKIYDGVIYIIGQQEATTKFVLYSTCTTALASETAVANKSKLALAWQDILIDTSYIYMTYSGSDSILKIARGNI